MLRVLAEGELEVLGRMPYASNATLLVRVRSGDVDGLAVYKPRRGERPLWDFPDGTLCLRERAAWVVDGALGWELVPPTVLRDGPAGFGAVQLLVDEDPQVDFESLFETHLHEMRRLAAFDVVVNNADRKAGHCIVDSSERLWAIDHGVTFSVDEKLRTVVWAFAGDALPDDVAADLERLEAELLEGAPVHSELAKLLHASEVDALVARVARLVRDGRYPAPGPGRRHVPWPPW